jgi:hypothetical protein
VQPLLGQPLLVPPLLGQPLLAPPLLVPPLLAPPLLAPPLLVLLLLGQLLGQLLGERWLGLLLTKGQLRLGPRQRRLKGRVPAGAAAQPRRLGWPPRGAGTLPEQGGTVVQPGPSSGTERALRQLGPPARQAWRAQQRLAPVPLL